MVFCNNSSSFEYFPMWSADLRRIFLHLTSLIMIVISFVELFLIYVHSCTVFGTFNKRRLTTRKKSKLRSEARYGIASPK